MIAAHPSENVGSAGVAGNRLPFLRKLTNRNVIQGRHTVVAYDGTTKYTMRWGVKLLGVEPTGPAAQGSLATAGLLAGDDLLLLGRHVFLHCP